MNTFHFARRDKKDYFQLQGADGFYEFATFDDGFMDSEGLEDQGVVYITKDSSAQMKTAKDDEGSSALTECLIELILHDVIRHTKTVKRYFQQQQGDCST